MAKALKNQSIFRERAAKKVLAKYALLIQGDAKKNLRKDPRRIDDGILWGSIQILLTGLVAQVFTNIDYACVTAKTDILTKRGSVRATKIVVGDMVLTQAGVYKPVLQVHKYAVPEGDEMITIGSRWRSGSKAHSITVTPNHKIMVYRDGRNKWVAAGEIVVGDEVYQRTIVPHNKGTRPVKTCIQCGRQHQNQGKKYCGYDCRNAAWTDGGSPLCGRKRSAKERANMSIGQIRRLYEKPETHPSVIVNKKGHKTGIERDTIDFLNRMGIEFEEQVCIGRYVVDFYCKKNKAIIEADGAYWHKDQERDIRRDQKILDILGRDWKIYHLHFFDKRHSPVLNTAPIPNVYYIPMNPGTKSFVDPETFRKTPVTSIKKFTYKRSWERGRGTLAVYDFGIEDIHSYYANGFLVSNSFVHWGTGIHGKNPKGGHRLTPWIYFDEKRQKFFVTTGMEPNMFLKNAWDKYRERFVLEMKVALRKSDLKLSNVR